MNRIKTGLKQDGLMANYGQVIFFYLFFFLLFKFVLSDALPVDGGTFQHIVMGESIFNTGLIYREPYTFTMENVPWISHGWFAEILMAGLNRLGGLDAIWTSVQIVIASLFTWLGVTCVRRGLHPLAGLLVLSIVVLAIAPFVLIRPLLFTFIGIALTQTALTAYEHGRVSLKKLAWLIPIYWIWGNAHPGVVGGIGILELTWVGWCCWYFMKWPSPFRSWLSALQCQGVIVACILILFVGPYGVQLPALWWVMINQHLETFILEWWPLYAIYPNPVCWLFIATVLAYMAILYSIPWRQWRVVWLTPAFMAIQGFLHIRQSALFELLAVLVLVDTWPYLKSSGFRPFSYKNTKHYNMMYPLVLCIIFTVTSAYLGAFGKNKPALDPSLWPVDMVDTLKQYEPKVGQKPSHLFNEFIQGGFVLYHAPGYKLFIDDHVELFGERFVLNYLDAAQNKAATASYMKQWQKQYGQFDYALVRQDGAFADWFAKHPNQWLCVKHGATFNFYRHAISA